MSEKKDRMVVIGAGVIGLQTALHLVQSGHPVTIVAKHFPGDWSLSYTSPRAGAHWRSQSSDPFIQRADAETYKAWSDLLSRLDEEEKRGPVDGKDRKDTGLALTPSIHYWDESTHETADNFQRLGWKKVVRDFKVLPPSELPVGVAHGISFTTFAINPTQYMRYLLSECRALGVKTLRKELGALEEIFSDPDLQQDVAAVVNCSGMGARNLVGDKDVFPIKGQTVLVRGECQAVRFRKTKSGWQDAVIRRPGAGTILGVSKDTNDWSEDVNPNLTRTILERCKQLAPELLVDGKFEVMQVQIGRRPARRGGVRIEVESLETTGGKRLVCHHYGHGGMGSDSPWPPLADAPFRRLTLKGSFQTAVGSANEAVRLLLKAMSNDRTSKL